jgi:exopolysaccharide biosynthesis protein
MKIKPRIFTDRRHPVLAILFILSIPVSIFSQDFKTVHDGVEYAEVTKEISGLKVNMNLLRLDLTRVRIDVVHAMDEAIGVEKTSSIATRHGALAAINAGFFRLDSSLYAGDAAGALMIDGSLYSEPNNDRIALLIANRAEITAIGMRPLHTFFMNAEIGGKLTAISGINRERKKDEIIVFTPEFHRTTLTGRDGVEVVVENNKVTKIARNGGSSVIPRNGFVLSADEAKAPVLLANVKIGMKVRIILDHHSLIDGNAGGAAEDIVAGVPQLIKNGKIDITWEQEKSTKAFVETRHPRTAVAKLKDGKFLMITVDGRSEISGGIGLQDLAEYLLSLGAIDAMNLDGGGSTTMFLDGKVVNHPSDKEGERKVSDALLVTPRR